MTAPIDPTVAERLIRIETKLDAALSRGDDHETRIRALEKARWPIPSIAALVAVASLVVAILSYMAKTGG